MDLQLAVSAVEDLRAIKTYYRDQGVTEVGEEFVNAVLDHFQMLAEHPDAGRVVPEFNQVSLREIIHPPFRIVYWRQSNLITLIRVWRSERILRLPDF